MKWHHLLFAFGSLLVLIAHFAKSREEVVKEKEADESKKTADAKSGELATQIAQVERNEAERARLQNETMGQLLDVQTAAGNVKAEYERRLQILKTPGKDNSERIREAESRELPDPNIDAKIADVFANAPAAVAKKLEETRQALEAENKALSRAVELNEPLRAKLLPLLDAFVATVKRTSDKGFFQVESITPLSDFPERVIFSGAEFGTKTQGHERLMTVKFTNGSWLEIGIHMGAVESPKIGSLKLSRPDEDGIQYPEFFIQGASAGGKGQVSGTVGYSGVSRSYKAAGNTYPEWAELNRTFAADGSALASNAIVVILGKLRVGAALEGAPKDSGD